MSFQNQLNHEVKSFQLVQLIRHKNKLAHLGSIQIALCNYELEENWFSNKIVSRRSSMEVESSTLQAHLALRADQVQACDKIAVSAIDANAILLLIS